MDLCEQFNVSSEPSKTVLEIPKCQIFFFSNRQVSTKLSGVNK